MYKVYINLFLHILPHVASYVHSPGPDNITHGACELLHIELNIKDNKCV